MEFLESAESDTYILSCSSGQPQTASQDVDAPPHGFQACWFAADKALNPKPNRGEEKGWKVRDAWFGFWTGP